MKRACTSAASILAIALFSSAIAHAQQAPARKTTVPPTGDEKAAAEALFVEAQRLIAAGNFADACPKLEDSERRDPGIGTMLYLADCYEKIGRIASAWAEFKEAEDQSHKENDQRAEVARKHADALEPRLAKLTIKIGPGAEVPGLVIRRDDKALGPTEWGTAIPVDPGKHIISAVAPKKKEWHREVTISPLPGTTESMIVPVLEDAPEPPPPPKPQVVVEEPTKGNTQRVVGLVVAGVGLAGVVTGSVLGFAAKSKYDESNPTHCSNNFCDATGTQERHDAYGIATSSDIFFIAGGVLVAGGVVLYFTAPRAKLVNVGIAPTQGGARAGASISF